MQTMHVDVATEGWSGHTESLADAPAVLDARVPLHELAESLLTYAQRNIRFASEPQGSYYYIDSIEAAWNIGVWCR